VLEADPTLTAGLAEAERVNTTSTRLGGRDVTEQVTAWSVDRAYDSDLPAPLRATNGSAAAELRLTLAGTEEQSAAQLYSPYAPHATADAARPGQSAMHGWGINGAALPALRGTVRDRAADSRTGRVDLSALDGAEKLRDAARLPAVISTSGATIASGHWIVDHLLREAGIHSSPPPRADCILYASMHGGVVPDVGFFRSHGSAWPEYTTTRTETPWQMALLAYNTPYTIRWDPRTRTTVGGRGLYLEMWVANPGFYRGAGSQMRMTLVFQADNIVDNVFFTFDFQAQQMNIGSEGNSSTTKGDAGFNINTRDVFHIGVHWTWSGTTPRARYQISSPSLVGGYYERDMGSFAALAPSQLNYVELTGALPVEAVQASIRSAPMTRAEFDAPWTRGAVVEGLTSRLTAIPPTQGSAWDVITAVARAEQSTAEFDPHGVFRYRPNRRFRSPGTPALTVTSAREIASLRVSEAIDSVRNVVDVPYQQYQAASPAQRFTDTGLRSVTSGGTLTLTFDYDVSEYDSPPPVLYATTIPSGTSRARFSTTAGGFVGLQGAIESTTERDGNQLRVSFRNLSSGTVYMVTTSGANSLAIWSQRLASGSPTRLSARSYNATSRTRYGAQVYQVPATPWIQRPDTAAQIATYLLDMAALPLPLLGDVEILPDPRIQLGDLVRVADEVGAALSTTAWVVGIRTSGDNAGRVRQVLTLRATTSPGAPTDTGLTPDPVTDPTARDVLAREGIRVP
jgi:hypothetical protein